MDMTPLSAKDKVLTCVLTPLSWIYGMVTWVRNFLFDKGVLQSREFDVPVICVGNITVGGTGKTPHVEYILNNIASDVNVAVLSRGYRRHTKGFVLANPKSTPRDIGDEPMQIYCKFGSRVKVAVCEKRGEGIQQLTKLFPDIQLVLLDDAFQHRYVKPKMSILLMDHSHPFDKDRLLPLGRLRESTTAVNRADIVVVTKCPDNMSPIDLRLLDKRLQLMPYQKLFFSRFEYLPLKPVFVDDAPYHASLASLTSSDAVMVLTGIANPRPLVRHLQAYPFRKLVEHFPDHHDFTRSDIMKIEEKFRNMKGERRIIVTTEKDAMRLIYNPYYPKELKPYTFYIPVAVRMLPGLKNENFMDVVREMAGMPRNPDDRNTWG